MHTQSHIYRRLINDHRCCYENMDNNSLGSFKEIFRDEHKFRECLSCGKFHLLDSCVCDHDECFVW